MQDTEFFVTLGVMTDGAIPPGHAFLAISKLDKTDPNAKVEFLTGFSFYSQDFMGILKPMSAGRVITEELKWIVNMPGLKQVSYPVTHNQLTRLLAKVNQDRHDFTYHHDHKPKEGQPTRPGGPYFNLFVGDNCKNYCLNCLEEAKIDVSDLRSFMEIPKLTNYLKPMYVSCSDERIPKHIPLKERQKDPRDKNGRKIPLIDYEHGPFYWETPLNIIRGTKQHQRWSQFAEIIDTANNMQKIIEARMHKLHTMGKSVQEINRMNENLLRLLASMKRVQAYPNQLTKENNQKYIQALEQAVIPQIRSLNQKGIELDLISMLVNMLGEMVTRLTSYFMAPKSIKPHQGNALDLLSIKQAGCEIIKKKHKLAV